LTLAQVCPARLRKSTIDLPQGHKYDTQIQAVLLVDGAVLKGEKLKLYKLD